MIPDARYVLPLRWRDDAGLPELVSYLRQLVEWIPVTVVDGSAPELFRAHAAALPAGVVHLPPEPWPGGNGKVAGVMTGVTHAREERLILADDDVRYGAEALHRVVALLAGADLVRPQNYFAPLPWHARWDTGRTLLNRAFGADYPGTLGVRRSRLLAAGGYDGDVLFENLELIRTIRAAGGREVIARDLCVPRLPPTVRHFVGQRIRQAYDDFAQPGRLAAELSLAPLLLWAARRPPRLLVLVLAAIGAACWGRRGAEGAFDRSAPLWAPVWLLERAVCIWLAVGYRLRGGVPYAGSRLRTAAHSRHELQQRHAGGAAPRVAGATAPATGADDA
ncbi:glycosyltransferase family 2 protein [Zhihengliuella sp.]|uniref:glycosyltransferase n=1 Tax=Zhihengliuella sp. TaxID=1954483 RepID=UPI00281236C8|nr:glycosyltransferase family 2 protein [Zhihengliuella sp.]